MTAVSTLPPASVSSVPHDDRSRLAAIVADVPEMSGQAYEIAPLTGGLTNRNYVVTAADSSRLVVRLSSEQSALLAIDRRAEWANATAAASTGIAPRVLAFAPEQGALAIEWIEGRTFNAADLDDSTTLIQVAAACRRLHSGPRFASEFDMFALQRRYLDLVISGGFRLPPSYLDFMPQVEEIRDAMETQYEGTVPCHNDLLAANIMASGNQLWFIDFEYSGNADPCFELGNIASESHLSTDRLTELVGAYYGRATAGKVARARLFALMSNYGWTLWASIQAATSDLDFDFWSWGLEKYERSLEAFHGADLNHLITEVHRP